MADDPNETPAPLSDAEIDQWSSAVRHFVQTGEEPLTAIMPRLLATLAARDARIAALERENAALREIVAAVAALEPVSEFDHETGYEDVRYDLDAVADICRRARALLAGMQTPGQESE